MVVSHVIHQPTVCSVVKGIIIKGWLIMVMILVKYVLWVVNLATLLEIVQIVTMGFIWIQHQILAKFAKINVSDVHLQMIAYNAS